MALLVASCAPGATEQQILRGYFDVCAIADDVALANVALVTIDPKRDGVVGRFRIVRVGGLERHPGSSNLEAVRLSLLDPHRDHDRPNAVLASETVELVAELHREGTAVEQPMSVTLARAETPDTPGRWIVVRVILDGRTLPSTSLRQP